MTATATAPDDIIDVDAAARRSKAAALGDCTYTASKLDYWHDRRTTAILAAHLAGASYREIGKALGTSHMLPAAVIQDYRATQRGD